MTGSILILATTAVHFADAGPMMIGDVRPTVWIMAGAPTHATNYRRIPGSSTFDGGKMACILQAPNLPARLTHLK